MITAFVALAALQPALPPRIASVPLPPPVIMPVVRTDSIASRQNRPAILIQVRVSGGGQQLFADTMRVGQAGATYNQSAREEAEQPCGTNRTGLERSLSLQLSPSYGEDDRHRLMVTWRRPHGNGCDIGSRTAGLEQTLALPAGRTVRLEGDAGLVVELTRR